MQRKIQSFDRPPPNYNINLKATNGFSHRPSPAQIASYIVIALTIAVYCSSTFTLGEYPVLMALYAVSGVIMVVSSTLATIMDPTDRVVYYYKWSLHDKKISFIPEVDKMLYCTYCDSYCWINSKHCRVCNRCVKNFDHHCMWFNNCVGECNYKYFFVSIVSTFTYCLIIIVHVALVSFTVDLTDGSQMIKIILSWIVALICGVFGLLLFNLIALHLYLWGINQTTYQFLQRRKIEEEQQATMKRTEKVMKENTDKKVTSLTHLPDITKNKHIDIESDESYVVNTKAIIVHQKRQAKEGEIIEQYVRQERSEAQRHTKMHEGEDLAKEVSQQVEVLVYAQSHHKLPTFLRNNKSLALLLPSPRADSPSQKKLQSAQAQMPQQ